MSDRSIKSAERTLQILEHFARVQQPLTVGYLAKTLSVPQPSMSMLLRNIANLGYLDYDRNERTYLPTIRTLLLGSWLERTLIRGRSFFQHIDEVHEATGEGVYVSRQNGAFVQYILGHRVRFPIRSNEREIRRNVLTRTTCGPALVARKPDDEILGWINRCNSQACDQQARVARETYLDRIARVREKGYSESRGDYIPGFSGVSVAFTLPLGGSPVAIAVGGPTDEIEVKKGRIVSALRGLVEQYQAA